MRSVASRKPFTRLADIVPGRRCLPIANPRRAYTRGASAAWLKLDTRDGSIPVFGRKLIWPQYRACLSLSVANYKIGLNSGVFEILIRCRHARHPRRSRSFDRHHRSAYKPGGLRAVVGESALTRHQLLILNRSRKRAPSLRVSDRIIVLVQREMESGRSPLMSIALASAGTRKQRTETATGFKKRSVSATIGAPGALGTEIVALRPGGGLRLTEAHTRTERPTG
jgi:hypothetical protein